MNWGFRVIVAVILADFLSGLAHWIEDSYFTPETPFLGPTIRKNILHHADSRAFVANPWHVTIWSCLVCSVVSALLWWPAGLLGKTTGLALLIAVFANQVHKWSHMTPEELPALVRHLQNWRLLQTKMHHAAHHQEQKNRRYCVLTNWVNPTLDGLRFWRGLEALIYFLTGDQPRPDPPVQTASG